jgi:hypothetical protein
MKRNSKLTIAITTAGLAVVGGAAVYAQDKYSLNSPSGIAFSDFKGYEDWAVVSSARTDEVLKVIVANPTMIEAYKAGVPHNGQPFPDWFQDREASVEAEEEYGGPIRRGCARRLYTGLRHRKGQQEISAKRRMGIRPVQLRSRIRQFHGRSQPLGLRTRVPCGGEGEGPHLPPVPEALMALARTAPLSRVRRHHRRTHCHRNSTERWPSLDGAERLFESRTIFIDSVLQQSAAAQLHRQCARNRAVAIPKRNRRPQSDIASRVVMKEPTRLRLDSRQLEFGRGFECHTSILISSSARSSKTRAA